MRGIRNIITLVCVCFAASVSAQTERMYRCELGVQGGFGYYVGDATEHVFHDVREAYGLHFRYKFDPRWAVQVKGIAHRIAGKGIEEMPLPDDNKWATQMVNVDVMGEFNFFRLSIRPDTRKGVKRVTPYIGVGVGASVCLETDWGWREKLKEEPSVGKDPAEPMVQIYVPFVLGMKWKFAERWNLQVAWQHNVYFADNLEGISYFNNTHNLNGSNFLNGDVTSQITLGIVFEFAKEHGLMGRTSRSF